MKHLAYPAFMSAILSHIKECTTGDIIGRHISKSIRRFHWQ